MILPPKSPQGRQSHWENTIIDEETVNTMEYYYLITSDKEKNS